MPAEIITAGGTGLLTSLMASGIQRLGSLVFQKVARLARIDAVLKGAAVKNPAVQNAIADFEAVVGSKYGNLTVELDCFIKELERSGIITTMVESALLNNSSSRLLKKGFGHGWRAK